jgi:hypothetical protein
MRVKVWFLSHLFVLAVVAASLLVSCGQDKTAPAKQVIDNGSTTPDDQQTTGARLTAALGMLNEDLTDPQPRNIGFTDWSLMKKYMNQQNLDGTSSVEDKRDFVLAFGENQAAGASEWLSADSYRSTWGFDVDWELGGDSFSILKFRDGFDFEEWRLNLISQSYVEEDGYREAIVLTTKDLSVPFHRKNVVFLPQENILVLSEEARSESLPGALDIVDLIKDDTMGLADDEAILETFGQLGDVASAIISLNRCNVYTQPARYLNEVLLPSGIEENISQYLDEKGAEILFSAHNYTVFGIGYRYEDGLPIVVMVFHYDDPADARADLRLRREMIADAPTLRHRSLSFADFHTVTDSYVDGQNLVLELLPVQKNPKDQFEMINNRELFFTMCGN